jgi:hypothetical protein
MKPKSASTVRRYIAELQSVVDSDDLIASRLAYFGISCIRRVTEEVRGWPTLERDAYDTAHLIVEELTEDAQFIGRTALKDYIPRERMIDAEVQEVRECVALLAHPKFTTDESGAILYYVTKSDVEFAQQVYQRLRVDGGKENDGREV